MGGQVQPIHYDPATVQQLTKEIAIASATGAAQGAVISIADKQLLKFQSKYYETELKRRSRILDEAAERGIFLEEEAAASSTVPQPPN